MKPVPMGEGALRMPRPPGPSAAALLELLEGWPGVLDVVVSEDHVLLLFDPLAPPDDPSERLRAVAVPSRTPRQHELRVRYDGPDLEDVARALGLAVDDLVALHGAADLEVKMIGFLPGFAYLGDLDPRLRLARRGSPRPRVPAGAVAVAGPYSAVYPFSSPGGWHLVGTVVDFVPFSPIDGAALHPGDQVRFRPA